MASVRPRRRDAADPPALRRRDPGGPDRRPAPGTICRRARRAGLRGPGPAPWPDGPGRLPGHPSRPQRRRRCLPGRVPPAGRKARSLWIERFPGRLAPSRGVAGSPSRSSPTPRDAAIRNGGPPSWPAARRRSAARPGDDATRCSTRRSTGCPIATASRSCSATWKHMTYQQAADHLRWSEGTTQGRLARARSLLQARLTRRGVTLAVSALGTLAQPPGASAVSLAMVLSTVRTARSLRPGANRRRRDGLDGGRRPGEAGIEEHVHGQAQDGGACGACRRCPDLRGHRPVPHGTDRRR